ALARELAALGADQGQLIDHNQLGPLTARGWLGYLRTHAGLEGMRLR
ncbi:MAG: DinB family protein, partial [Chloroflexales bacterium]|nr:DinB family protein [Chloroflexales bacterium]